MDRAIGHVLVLLTLLSANGLFAAEPCETIHGRAQFFEGDGQLRIWHIGTNHEYEPDETSWLQVMKWLEAGVQDSDRAKYESDRAVNPIPVSTVYLYADFLICPTEPFKKGSVQRATVKSASHRRYTRVEAAKFR